MIESFCLIAGVYLFSCILLWIMHRPTFERDSKYLKWIRSLPCCVRNKNCTGSIQAHHTARAFHGLKGGDYSAIPLCAGHHFLVQSFSWKFKERYGFIPDESYARKHYYEKWLEERNDS
jgi:hypothetical protein